MKDPQSKIERVKLQGRETSTHLATVDDLIAHNDNEGGAIIEFVRNDSRGKPLESFRVSVCPEDLARIKAL
ncbi:hypothetical protein [Tardiphaga sp. 367_B4_N1_1]|uniref:hypothetical protein n=1 Tax=Tardiphaga sp. 367_B4_N1_1 TaxID=3240777 RepID=UPI003F23D0A8